MSSVLVLVIIPEREYEEEIREKAKLSSKLRYKSSVNSKKGTTY